MFPRAVFRSVWALRVPVMLPQTAVVPRVPEALIVPSEAMAMFVPALTAPSCVALAGAWAIMRCMMTGALVSPLRIVS